ncbi:transcription factor, RsfA family protein [Anoxybacillus sp. B7M1]|jgi:prespore-specific regulator|uniref:RsfA family transcriptional regulator n=1 Tax=Anoxybacteroides rupiense TaxID=311460 RepID=A0ABD5IQZ3_9BACL|nr:MULTISPECIES: RsfA family transcriptional regulator [Anoxybacillus]ANB58606.1 transcription factor, RsfA family protein [Anoxybacillus sp. B2M1]ANB62662.1 transcription factor, RsfA family protein [Anoxybacillus sp. B7M1]KXG10446.1 Prespore-specific transcriptional regulator RsfA [Anoxybacillus sp. P3H1B]MBB3906270.1 RsfA family transcription factor [Anoxybacillus rupiensis]MBS2770746.1 RsfA family transcriptional regulator [Anoxybacillus rupiensis]
MTSVRQDAWTQDEDLLLAEIVLRYIREGGTQLQAFEEVGRRLSRTAAACGFRWNSYVRKQYKEAIELAKKQRKEVKKERTQLVQKEAGQGEDKTAKLTWQDIIAFLQRYQQSSAQYQHVMDENRALKRDMEQLQQMITKLQLEKERLQKELKAVQEDYKTFIGIMERARKMVILEEEQTSKVKFQMDRNGNLEKIEK